MGGVEPWLMARWKARVTLSQDFRGNGSSLGNIFGFYKTRHIMLSASANCTVLRSVVLTHYRRVTDRRTDGIAVANRPYSACNASIAERCKNSGIFFDII